MANSGPKVMSSVMFPSSSECFPFNVIAQTDEEYLRIKQTINFFKLEDQNTTSSHWFLCIFISLVEKNLITNQIAHLLLYSYCDYCTIYSPRLRSQGTQLLYYKSNRESSFNMTRGGGGGGDEHIETRRLKVY